MTKAVEKAVEKENGIPTRQHPALSHRLAEMLKP
jgi:hypothetical protein